jgi:hypothetical protein
MTVDAGHDGGCLNFVAEIHRMPEYSWQCLDFRGTGHSGFGQVAMLLEQCSVSQAAYSGLTVAAASRPK